MPTIDDERKARVNSLNDNFEKKEFKALWERINHKAAYAVDFETPELISKCVVTLDNDLKINPLQYTVATGMQADDVSYDDLKAGESFKATIS
jgi:type III restriction enzyme